MSVTKLVLVQGSLSPWTVHGVVQSRPSAKQLLPASVGASVLFVLLTRIALAMLFSLKLQYNLFVAHSFFLFLKKEFTAVFCIADLFFIVHS